MRSKIGKFMIFSGTLLLIAALSLFLYNRKEAMDAAASSEAAAGLIRDEIIARIESGSDDLSYTLTDDGSAEADDEEPEPFFIDGYRYLGYLTLPTLGLEVPVMYGWSYPQLKLSPCRYSGDAGTHDLVIMAHNYSRHFGRLRDLDIGDEVCFVDMSGRVYTYEVTLHETLEATAIEHMTNGGYDLTLFTCTYGGQARIAVRCTLAESG